MTPSLLRWSFFVRLHCFPLILFTVPTSFDVNFFIYNCPFSFISYSISLFHQRNRIASFWLITFLAKYFVHCFFCFSHTFIKMVSVFKSRFRNLIESCFSSSILYCGVLFNADAHAVFLFYYPFHIRNIYALWCTYLTLDFVFFLTDDVIGNFWYFVLMCICGYKSHFKF